MHERLNVTKHEIETTWCYDDVLEAHDMLDMFDAIQSDAMKAAQADARARAKGRRR